MKFLKKCKEIMEAFNEMVLVLLIAAIYFGVPLFIIYAISHFIFKFW